MNVPRTTLSCKDLLITFADVEFVLPQLLVFQVYARSNASHSSHTQTHTHTHTHTHIYIYIYISIERIQT